MEKDIIEMVKHLDTRENMRHRRWNCRCRYQKVAIVLNI